jgi:hypothetical protein
MPASMMSADAGGRTNVAGSSIAIVATGPIPGNTPMRVPNKTPRKQYTTFCAVRATSKPNCRLANNSIMSGTI